MNLQNVVALVTGANRGLGREIARALVANGAKKVYGGARDPDQVRLFGVTPIRLDVTNGAEVAEAAEACHDTQILVNNAGVAKSLRLMSSRTMDSAREMFETNFFSLVRTSQAFSPILAANGGGAIVNVLSAASWGDAERLGMYAASKAAAWSFTNSLRSELRVQNTLVVGLHAVFLDTAMSRGFEVDKTHPGIVAEQLIEALKAGAEEVLTDASTRNVKRGISDYSGIYH